ncbi:MAG: hypothetical protein KDB23_31550, partial [Planctomycetales bacterium]|nr:hypothetical protein [Planctomycetales bacterium]
ETTSIGELPIGTNPIVVVSLKLVNVATRAISDGCTCLASPTPYDAPIPRLPIAELADML